MVHWEDEDTARLQAVWKRVQTGENKTVAVEQDVLEFGQEEQVLADFLRRTARMVAQYRGLARRGGPLGALGSRFAGTAMARYRRLQLEWFLRRGDCYPQAPEIQTPQRYLEAMRSVIQEARRLSKDYLAAAALEGLRPLCLVFSQAESEEAEAMCRLLERAI